MKIELPLGRCCLRWMTHSSPVRIETIRLLRSLSLGEDSLVSSRLPRQTGKQLGNETLRRVLAEDEMGAWSMSPRTIDFLEAQIRRKTPSLILEMGSGLSTLCLARFMAEAHPGATGISVCSIEQDGAVITKTMRRLETLGLDRYVRMFHAPLAPQTIEGISTTCYALPREFVEAMQTLHPDFVIIDGPAADTGARFGTLPLVRPFLQPGTRFFLDDALRDGEIDVAERWQKLAGIRVDGVLLTEKGMLMGEVGK